VLSQARYTNASKARGKKFMQPFRKNHAWPTWLGLLLLASGVLWIYWGVWNFAFVWDDKVLLLDQSEYRSEGWLRAVLASFALELRGYGVTSAPLHITNLILHGLNVSLVFALARQCAKAKEIAGWGWPLLAAALYAFHPALVESAAWISGRFDLLVTFFALLGLLLVAGPLSASRLVAIALVFLAAALCKELAVVMPLLLLLWRRMMSAEPLPTPAWLMRADNRRLILVLCLTGAGYLLLRYQAMGFLLGDYGNFSRIPFTGRIFLIAKSLTWYLWLTVWPFFESAPQHVGQVPISSTDAMVWLGLAAWLTVLALFIFWWRNSQSVLAALALGYVLALLPVLGIFTPRLMIGLNFVADRFLTLPLVFFALFAMLLLQQIVSWVQARELRLLSATMIGIATLWLAWGGINAHANVQFWRSNLTLWTWVVARDPDSAIGQTGLIEAYIDIGAYEKALVPASRMLQLQPEGKEVRVNYAFVLQGLGRLEEAKAILENLVQQNTVTAPVEATLGRVYMKLEKNEEARKHFQRALELEPKFWQAMWYFALLEQRAGNADKASELLEEVKKLAPPGTVIEHDASADSGAISARPLPAKTSVGVAPAPAIR
jgi:tetratricopeptide (TPR) repeat protein